MRRRQAIWMSSASGSKSGSNWWQARAAQAAELEVEGQRVQEGRRRVRGPAEVREGRTSGGAGRRLASQIWACSRLQGEVDALRAEGRGQQGEAQQ
jgi:hypothetical protein